MTSAHSARSRADLSVTAPRFTGDDKKMDAAAIALDELRTALEEHAAALSRDADRLSDAIDTAFPPPRAAREQEGWDLPLAA